MSTHLQLHGILPSEVPQRTDAPDHRLLACGPHLAIVSDSHDPVAFEALPPEHVARWALTHNAILCSYCSDHALLPMRVGTVFLNEDAIRREVAAHSHRFTDALTALSDLREYTLRISVSDIMPPPSPATATGRNHLRLGRSNHDARQSQDVARHHFARSALAELDTMALQVEPAGAPKPDRLLDCVALLPKAAVPSLHSMAQRLSDPADALSLLLTVTGPWPAYSFDLANFPVLETPEDH